MHFCLPHSGFDIAVHAGGHEHRGISINVRKYTLISAQQQSKYPYTLLSNISEDYLKTFPRISKKFIQCSRLTLLHCVVIEYSIRVDSSCTRIQSTISQQILGIQHFRHRDTMTKAFIHGCQD